MSAGENVYAYIDETGDRGNSNRSSPIFGMAATVLDELGAAAMRGAVERLRLAFKVPDDKVLSWKDYVKTHDRRRRATAELGTVAGVRLCCVYSVKSALRAGSYLDDQRRFYNCVAYTTYKSVLWAARSWKGPHARIGLGSAMFEDMTT